ncbi:(2Fe-2S)-binding protein [bacterium]|nr:MAG: (2Fe-2S)-binding protein [bacterium]
MRIEKHPILDFERGKKVAFKFEGKTMYGYEGEPIAAALHDNGVKVLRYSIRHNRPRGFFCAIGRCSSCLMEVDGIPNIRTCITPLKEGMEIRLQKGKGKIV